MRDAAAKIKQKPLLLLDQEKCFFLSFLKIISTFLQIKVFQQQRPQREAERLAEARTPGVNEAAFKKQTILNSSTEDRCTQDYSQDALNASLQRRQKHQSTNYGQQSLLGSPKHCRDCRPRGEDRRSLVLPPNLSNCKVCFYQFCFRVSFISAWDSH